MMRDQHYMTMALSLAKRHQGLTAPNPSVGCVVVKNNVIVGRGVTARGGRPHAETEALNHAGKQAKGATVYVTLEPCCHHGKTPPCTEALIRSGVARVVIATTDPDARMRGQSISILEQAGIRVKLGIGEKEARAVNAGFFSVIEKSRPFVTLKLATSKDYKIAHSDGQSKWITGESARAFGHLFRAQQDAILVGIGTVKTDDPLLSCRLNGLETCSPIRVIVDVEGELSTHTQVVKTAKQIPTWQLVRKQQTSLAGVQTFSLPTHRDKFDIVSLVQFLGKRGVTRLLVEGGSKIAAAFIQASVVDQLIHMEAPHAIGKNGIDALYGLSFTDVLEQRFTLVSSRTRGVDNVFTYRARKSNP